MPALLTGMDPVALEEYHRGIKMAAARGHQQRQAARHRAAEPQGDPEFADNLLKDWVLGIRLQSRLTSTPAWPKKLEQ